MEKEWEEKGKRNRRDTLLVIIIVLVLVPLTVFLVRRLDPGYTREPLVVERYLLDDMVTITAYGKDRRKVERAVEDAFRAMERVQDVADRYREGSELYAVNREASEGEVAVSDDLWAMLQVALEVYRSTGGAFDVTVGPLVDLWDVRGKAERGGPPPSREEIERVLPLVGMDKLDLDPVRRTVRFKVPGMSLDLGGLAKGYALDRAVDALRAEGVNSFVVNMVSTSAVVGEKPRLAGGPGWKVAVQNPRGEGFLGVLNFTSDAVVSTSGDYQRYFEYEGVRYHHILDPRTGYPASGLASLTVLGGTDGVHSDAYSTALFILGLERSLEWLGNREGLEAVLVTPDGAVHTTPGANLSR
jgi:thiamine biosynthesis lipoprotein